MKDREPRGERPPRDPDLDVLRGVAMLLMILAHVGPSTRLSAVAHFPFVLSAAEPFVLLAGLVLGMRARGGARPESSWRRARQLWGIHCVLMVAVLLVHEATGRLVVPSVSEAGGWLAVAWKVPTLRLQPLDYMNILPLFVVFFLVAPFVVRAFASGRTWLALAPSVLLWLLAQGFLPSWLRFTDPVSGDEAFVLPAWQLLFVLGVCLGFHFDHALSAWDRHSRWSIPVLAVVLALLFCLAQLQRSAFVGAGLRLPHGCLFLTDKATLGPVRLLYVLLCMAATYLALGWTRQRAPRAAARVLAPLELVGRRSLYCFLIHLAPALLASGLHLSSAPRFVQELATALAVAFVYLMARHHVLGRLIPG